MLFNKNHNLKNNLHHKLIQQHKIQQDIMINMIC